ncbi:MAG: hypothetical protein HKN44_10345 [Ilumatobacter sp.]|nr:hypothetical protein [Ilumatobacter sp.]
MRTTMAIVGGLCWLVAGCGSSEPASDTVLTPVVETGTINYAEGAFVRNDSSSTAGSDGAAPTATDAAETGTTAPAAASTTEASATTVEGDTTVSSTTAGSATTTSGSVSPLGVDEGIVTIGTVTYPFAAQTCDVDSLGFFVFGNGTSSGGDQFEVDISGETVDLDGDGTSDVNFDIFVVATPAVGEDASGYPEFYASKVQTSDFSEGDDLVLNVAGTTVSGSGPIEDFNGIVISTGETLPMTFEARCA